jgi:hypothetical protein
MGILSGMLLVLLFYQFATKSLVKRDMPACLHRNAPNSPRKDKIGRRTPMRLNANNRRKIRFHF